MIRNLENLSFFIFFRGVFIKRSVKSAKTGILGWAGQDIEFLLEVTFSKLTLPYPNPNPVILSQTLTAFSRGISANMYLVPSIETVTHTVLAGAGLGRLVNDLPICSASAMHSTQYGVSFSSYLYAYCYCVCAMMFYVSLCMMHAILFFKQNPSELTSTMHSTTTTATATQYISISISISVRYHSSLHTARTPP